MKLKQNLTKTLLMGSVFVLAGQAQAGWNNKLSLAPDASEEVKMAFADWKKGAAKGRKERCYGISLAGQNDCKAGPGTSCQGHASNHFQGNSYTMTPRGICNSIVTPDGPGSLDELERNNT